MNRTLVSAAALLLAFACASNDDAPPMRGGGRRGGGMGGGMDGGMDEGRSRMRTNVSVGDVTLPDEWWRDPRIQTAVALSADQVAKLDVIGKEQAEEIAKLERDGMVATRDFRNTLDVSQPAADDITAAGRRLRDLRGALLDRQVQMTASERLVLTGDQWRALQDQLRQDQRPQRDNYPGGGRRGRGGMGGGGRRPFPG
jgi:hypothetical protein